MKTKMCECGCENEAMVLYQDLHTNVKTFLCVNCLFCYINTALQPEEFFKLLKNGHTTDEFLLHEDFYDEATGQALQPRIK